MHNEEQHGESPYELSDVKVSIIVWTFIVTLVAMLIALVVMRWAEVSWKGGSLSDSPIAIERPVRTAAEQRAEVPTVPGPLLQDAPEKDLAEHIAQQEAMRDSYGWVDEEAGIAHIPVSEAMKHVVDHGIPDWSHLAPVEEAAQQD